MPQVRIIEINNFRTLKKLTMFPSRGLNCIIGPGDSGKSTVLDAIDLALGARRSYMFSDADFTNLNTNQPIEILVTLGALPHELLNFEKYGKFLRGFNGEGKALYDEPQEGCEVVITIKLKVEKDLNPDWTLYSARAETEDIERRLPWKHRELITPARLGVVSNHHLAWGNRSVLNKLSEESINVSDTLNELSRHARQSFSEQSVEGIDAVLANVKGIANGIGVDIGEVKALLDVKSTAFSNGAISLHDQDNTPLRQLGTGSTRLLISGLQKAASQSKILIVDEAEYGLEPFRITRLLNELGSKAVDPTQQVFITTHSPYVLRELQANQLHVLRKLTTPFAPPNHEQSHWAYSLSGQAIEQATLRACAEAFLSKKVIVCEGKSEIGLIKGIDLFNQSNDCQSIFAGGVFYADGAGDSMFNRALVFKNLGYPTAILKDSDVDDGDNTSRAQSAGIDVFEWGGGLATENAIFNSCPDSVFIQLLDYAVERKGEQAVSAHIVNQSQNSFNNDSVRINITYDTKVIVGRAAKAKSWYKDIEPMEHISRNIIMPNYTAFSDTFKQPINALFQWAFRD